MEFADSQPDELLDEIVAAYLTIARAIEALAAPHWDQMDRSLPQVKVLFIIAYRGPIAIGQIAQALDIRLPTASHLVDQIEQEGWAERVRDPADRRRSLARLTDKGMALIRRLRYGSELPLRPWLVQLRADQRAALHHGLLALAQVCQQGLAESAEQPVAS